jgi:hypothetical protein
MKHHLLAFSLLFTTLLTANQGGPDQYGYIWKDSNEPGGPTYQWWDITQIGTQLNGLGDDNFIGPISLGNLYPYYWYNVSKCWVGSNGYISFGPGNIAANFPNIPNPIGVNNYITGHMADLTFLGPNNPGRVYVYANSDSFCIQYQNVPYWSPSSPGYTGSNTFEIILNRADSTITVNFMSCTGVSQSNFVTGIENVSGNMGLQPLTTQPAANYTVRYYYPVNPSLSVTDASVSWNGNENTGGIFIPNMTGPYSLQTEIMNQGNTLLPALTVSGKITNLAGNSLVSDVYGVTAGLPPSQSIWITYPNSTFSPTAIGTNRFVTTIAPVIGDSTPVNDSIIQEIVVVDTSATTIGLNYTANHSNPVLNSISWNGGQGGVGVYIEPASYPARIVNTTFICASAPVSGIAFYAKVFDDDGPNGTPGTLLDSVPVMGNTIIPNSIVTVSLSSPVTINSGGVYVEWEMATSAVSIAQDLTPPFSRRTYEVFSSYWSTYRDYQICDFFIGLSYQKANPEDVGVSVITSPSNNSTIPGPTNVSCYIKNYGNFPDNYSIDVNYKLGNNPTIVTQQYNGPLINPGDSAYFTFSTQLLPPYSGNDVLYVWTSKSSDAILNNDTALVNVVLVGIQETQAITGMTVYPIPTNDNICFSFEKSLPNGAHIQIRDLQGKLVRSQALNPIVASSIITIDLTGLSNGTYTYSVIADQDRGTGVLIINR